MRKVFFGACLLFCTALSNAQNATDNGSAYNPHDFFLQGFNPPAGNSYRSANGSPGPQYWQNSASYVIHATLSEKDTSITGDVQILYTNNSPDKLDYLWLQLDQNLFNAASRGTAATPVSGDLIGVLGVDRGGYHITDVNVTYGGKTYKVPPVI